MKVAARRFLFIIRTGPAEDSRFLEALDMLLTVAAFDQYLRVLFVDEGVRHLTTEPVSASPRIEQARGMLDTLDLYDVREVLVGFESLRARGLSGRDCRIAVTALEEALIPSLIAEHERIQVV